MHSIVKPTHSTYTFAESPWKQLSVQKFPKTWNWLDLILLLCTVDRKFKIFRQQKNSSNEMIQFDRFLSRRKSSVISLNSFMIIVRYFNSFIYLFAFNTFILKNKVIELVVIHHGTIWSKKKIKYVSAHVVLNICNIYVQKN